MDKIFTVIITESEDGFGPFSDFLELSGKDRFGLTWLRGDDWALLRLVELDGVILDRNGRGDACGLPLGAAPASASILRLAEDGDQTRMPVLGAVSANPNLGCVFCAHAKASGTFSGRAGNCLVAVRSRVVSKNKKGRSRPDAHIRGVASLLLRATEKDWDHPIGMPDTASGRRQSVENWVAQHELLARAVRADALAWLLIKNSKPDDLNEVGLSEEVREHVLTCALAWRVQSIGSLRDARSLVLAASASDKVAVVWDGDSDQLRNLLRGLLVRPPDLIPKQLHPIDKSMYRADSLVGFRDSYEEDERSGGAPMNAHRQREICLALRDISTLSDYMSSDPSFDRPWLVAVAAGSASDEVEAKVVDLGYRVVRALKAELTIEDTLNVGKLAQRLNNFVGTERTVL